MTSMHGPAGCRYGCQNPSACRWSHEDCQHCQEWRRIHGWSPAVPPYPGIPTETFAVPAGTEPCFTCDGTGRRGDGLACTSCDGDGRVGAMCGANYGGLWCQWVDGHYGGHVLSRETPPDRVRWMRVAGAGVATPPPGTLHTTPEGETAPDPLLLPVPDRPEPEGPAGSSGDATPWTPGDALHAASRVGVAIESMPELRTPLGPSDVAWAQSAAWSHALAGGQAWRTERRARIEAVVTAEEPGEDGVYVGGIRHSRSQCPGPDRKPCDCWCWLCEHGMHPVRP